MITNPKEIEGQSFQIIRDELGSVSWSEPELSIVIRVIHTTADFDYAANLRFSKDSLFRAREALKKGCRIYTDTKMILAGVSQPILKKYGCEAYTWIDNPAVLSEAQSLGVTRSIVGMRRACLDQDTKIFLIGNAPTALFTLMEAVQQGECFPDLIIGVPVGFVGARESKEKLADLNIPHILTAGRKGGSTVAAAVMNAILYGMDE